MKTNKLFYNQNSFKESVVTEKMSSARRLSFAKTDKSLCNIFFSVHFPQSTNLIKVKIHSSVSYIGSRGVTWIFGNTIFRVFIFPTLNVLVDQKYRTNCSMLVCQELGKNSSIVILILLHITGKSNIFRVFLTNLKINIFKL